ncbi:MAG: transglutaminase domain-containing protein [Atopobiaceae bacterium]|nr:transglutaminase domain-containing protein [Atopobiaceae bacterium]
MVQSSAQKQQLRLLVMALLLALLSLFGCSQSHAEGKSFSLPEHILTSRFNEEAATQNNDAFIDVSEAHLGYFGARAVNPARLKLQVRSGDMSYNYDLPSDGTPIVVPVNMGNGHYEVRVMQNTSGTNYVELASVETDVTLDSEFDPYLRPNLFCTYTDESSCVSEARTLCADAQNQGEAVQAVCSYIIENVTYDQEKADALESVSGYVPNPDETLSSGKGICFDYASLGAAMLRSLGIPCRIVTGYVSPGELYHAWIVIYIDGEWQTAHFSVDQNTWSRVDLTFAAASSPLEYVGDGKTYTDRYTY